MNWLLAPAGHSPAMSGALSINGMKRAVRDMARIAELLLDRDKHRSCEDLCGAEFRTDNGLPTGSVDNAGDKLSASAAGNGHRWGSLPMAFFEQFQPVAASAGRRGISLRGRRGDGIT